MSSWRKIATVACVAGATAVPAASGAPLLNAEPFDNVAQGNGAASALTQPGDDVIRSPAQWQRAWQALNARVTPAPALPAVDFRRSMLLLVLQGQRGGSGYSIAVTGVTKVAGQLVARVEERSPGPGCMSSALMTAPYQVVRVPRCQGAVVFSHRRTSYTCP